VAIFLTAESRVLVQGITGSEGRKHGARMLAAGTKVVGGTNPKKAGTTVELNGVEVPVFGTVAETMAATGADVSVIFVPPAGAKAAVREAIDAEIPLAIVITEGIPVHDTAEFWAYATEKGNKTRIVGPNCPGIASPGKSNAGIIPADITTAGKIGLVSKSGTLTYQMMYELRDIGFSTAVGIGGDPIIGTTHIDCLAAFQNDPETAAVVMIGEIGGDAEERAAAFIEQHVTKPVVGYVAGFTAPEGKTMGHAGAIISGSAGTAQAKKEALEKAGVRVGKTPSETAAVVMIGEIGGDAEERAAAYIKEHITKPVVGYVAGFTAPEGKTMGHAGAIVSGSSGTAQAKKEALEAVGVKVGKTPSETAKLMREIIESL
jgi:succinyl-CoA synthetase alpha subunit